MLVVVHQVSGSWWSDGVYGKGDGYGRG